MRRDPALSDNGLLPAAFLAKVGDFIYTGLRDGFRVGALARLRALPLCASVHGLCAAFSCALASRACVMASG